MRKPRPQLTLFAVHEKPPIPDVSKLLDSGRDENITLAYVILSASIGKYGALAHILKEVFRLEKIKIASDLSSIIYFRFSIKGIVFDLGEYDGDGQILLGINGSQIFIHEWSDSETYNEDFRKKIEREVLHYLRSGKVLLERILP